jgi:hypothetical protein
LYHQLQGSGKYLLYLIFIPVFHAAKINELLFILKKFHACSGLFKAYIRQPQPRDGHNPALYRDWDKMEGLCGLYLNRYSGGFL